MKNKYKYFFLSICIILIAVVVYSLMFNGFDKIHVFIEYNFWIRLFEIVLVIFSLMFLGCHFIIKFVHLAEKR